MLEIIFDKFQFPHLSSPIMQHNTLRISFFLKNYFSSLTGLARQYFSIEIELSRAESEIGKLVCLVLSVESYYDWRVQFVSGQGH